MLSAMATVYVLLILLSHPGLFECYDVRIGSEIPSAAFGVIHLVMFMVAILIHGRQVEWTARLDFLWQVQVWIPS